MSIKNPYTIIATVDYADYAAIRELLLKHDIDPTIQPAEVGEDGQPMGSIVHIYVHLYSVEKANDLLADGELNTPVEEPLQTVKMTGHIVKLVPFLNKPLPVYFIYLVLTVVILAACVFVALHQKRSVF